MNNPVRFIDPSGMVAIPFGGFMGLWVVPPITQIIRNMAQAATQASSSSNPNRFDSPTAAATAFANRYNPVSIAEGREIGAAIFRVDVFETITTTHSLLFFSWTTTTVTNNIIDSFYTFGTRSSGIGGVARGPLMTSGNNFQGSVNTSNIPRPPNNHTRHTEVAQIHTHGPHVNLVSQLSHPFNRSRALI